MKTKSHGHAILILYIVSLLCKVSSANERYDIILIDPRRPTREIPTVVYIPYNISDKTMSTTLPLTIPLTIYGHGANLESLYYSYLQNEDYHIIAFPDTEKVIPPDSVEYAKDYLYISEYLHSQSQNNNSSPFFNILSPNYTLVSGHSLGGGTAYLVADPALFLPSYPLVAISGFGSIVAPGRYTIPPARESAMRMLDPFPSFTIAGANDCINPSDQHSYLLFDLTPTKCKIFIEITGATHCQFCDYSQSCIDSEVACGAFPGISREFQYQLTNVYTSLWTRYMTTNEIDDWNLLQNQIEDDFISGILSRWEQIVDSCIIIQ